MRGTASGRALRGCARGDTGLSLPIRGELGLPLKLEFEFQTLVLTFERLVLGYQLRGPFLRGVQLTLQPVEAVAARIGQTDQTPTRRAAQMRAMVQLRASVLVLGIKAEAHGRSSLNAGNLTNFLRPTSRILRTPPALAELPQHQEPAHSRPDQNDSRPRFDWRLASCERRGKVGQALEAGLGQMIDLLDAHAGA